MIVNVNQVKKDNAISEIQKRKPEIRAYLEAQKAAAEKAAAERAAKIAAIEGLEEIQNAIDAVMTWKAEFNRQMESESGVTSMPTSPADNIDDLRKQYPRAAAYLDAKGYANATHDVKCSCGKTALEKIINGDDYAAAIAEMETEWNNYCKDHMMD